ncbi:MAG: BON domain-containing protein [Armatimonadota bacterium]
MSIQDEALANRVRNALSLDKRISDLPIDVRISDGEAFLKGTARSAEQIEVVKFIASGVAGIRHIDTSELHIKGDDR